MERGGVLALSISTGEEGRFLWTMRHMTKACTCIYFSLLFSSICFVGFVSDNLYVYHPQQWTFCNPDMYTSRIVDSECGRQAREISNLSNVCKNRRSSTRIPRRA